MKKDPPTSEPQVEQPISCQEKEPSVPLDLLCNLAWRIVQARHALPTQPSNFDGWQDAVKSAYTMIQMANLHREKMHRDALPDPHVEKAVEVIRSKLTADELDLGVVPFGRGCRLITGVDKKQTAVDLFLRACEKGYMPISPRMLKDFEANGFFFDDMPELRTAFLRAKAFLRKNSAKTTE